MGAQITTEQVWSELEKQFFGIVGFVTAKGESRTAGIVYLVREKRVYFSTENHSWKLRHLKNNPNISMTVPIPNEIIPATITFSGTAKILDLSEVPEDIPNTLLNNLEPADELRMNTSIVEMTPNGDFITYGVGVSVETMLRPIEAAGRAPVDG